MGHLKTSYLQSWIEVNSMCGDCICKTLNHSSKLYVKKRFDEKSYGKKHCILLPLADQKRRLKQAVSFLDLRVPVQMCVQSQFVQRNSAMYKHMQSFKSNRSQKFLKKINFNKSATRFIIFLPKYALLILWKPSFNILK